MLDIMVSAGGAVNRRDKFHTRRPGPVVAGTGFHDTVITRPPPFTEGLMRDAEFHLPQAFVGALLACMLLVALLVANTASAATGLGHEMTPAACPAPGSGH